MKKAFLIASVIVLAVTSCHTDQPDNLADEKILFSPEEAVPTKAILTDATLKTSGNRIKVLDILTGFSGSATWMGDNVYVDDEITYSGNYIWDYVSGLTYPWTTDGVHQFYGWLSYDTAMDLTADSFFGATLRNNFSTANEARTLSIPALEMNTETPQFDFLYTKSYNYVMPRAVTDPVVLPMQHLFSAISILIRNESNDDVKISNVIIGGLQNKKSAEINLAPYSPVVTTTPQIATNSFVDNTLFAALPSATRTLANLETYDILARAKNVNVGAYRLIWPQTAAEIAPGNVNDYSTYPITVNYEFVSDEEHQQHTAHLRFPAGVDFEAGNRYALTLLFTQKHIELKFTVNPWNYELNEWSFDEQTISEVTELDFAGNEGYDKPSKTCRIVNGAAVKGTFKIVNPSGAIWSIEPVGDVEYFTISPSQGTVDSNNPNYEFYVVPNLDPSLDRTTDKKLKFNFYVRFTDGTTHDANTEINRDDWTVILPKN